MRIRASVLAGLVAAGLIAIAVCPAQQPKVSHTQLSVHSGSLQQEIAAAKAATWIGYITPTVHEMYVNSDDETQYLEGDRPSIESRPQRKPSDAQPLAMVLLRVSDGKVSRVQLDEPSRALDAGGVPFVWLNNISAHDSIAALRAAIEANIAANPPIPASDDKATREEDRHKHRVMDSGVMVIAMTDDPESVTVLRNFADAKYPSTVREQAAFWMANEHGRDGLNLVVSMLQHEKDDALRTKLIFDLTLVHGEAKSGAIDALINEAKTDESQHVRSQAQFWLAQQVNKQHESDPRIAATLADQAKNDPNTALRKSAIFALSRLPDTQAVPELIHVASTSKDPATRREAIFWLGRSKDPQALAYLEKVVKE